MQQIATPSGKGHKGAWAAPSGAAAAAAAAAATGVRQQDAMTANLLKSIKVEVFGESKVTSEAFAV